MARTRGKSAGSSGLAKWVIGVLALVATVALVVFMLPRFMNSDAGQLTDERSAQTATSQGSRASGADGQADNDGLAREIGAVSGRIEAMEKHTGFEQGGASLPRQIQNARKEASNASNDALLSSAIAAFFALLATGLAIWSMRRLTAIEHAVADSADALNKLRGRVKFIEDAPKSAKSTSSPSPSLTPNPSPMSQAGSTVYERDQRHLSDEELAGASPNGADTAPFAPPPPTPLPVDEGVIMASARELTRKGGTMLSSDYRTALEKIGNPMVIDLDGGTIRMKPGGDDGLPRPLVAALLDSETAILFPSHNYLKHFDIENVKIRADSNSKIRPFFNLEVDGKGNLSYDAPAVGKIVGDTIAIHETGRMSGFTD